MRNLLSVNLEKLMNNLQTDVNIKNTKELINFFELLEKLKIETEISNAQNVFYHMFCTNFETFFEKIKQIYMSKNAFHGPMSLIFKIIRVLFRYADNSSDLCVLNN